MATKKDWDAVEALFDYGLDLDNRRVYLFGDVEDSPIGNSVKAIYHLANMSDSKPIELFIGSFGGSEYEMMALYDVLNTVRPAPIHTVAIGKCMSAAPLLVAAGTPGHRYSMPNCQWMVHMGWEEPEKARYDEMRKTVEHYENLNQRWAELMAEHTKPTAKQWMQICKRVGDKYFDAEEAIKYGLVDQIWDERDEEDE